MQWCLTMIYCPRMRVYPLSRSQEDQLPENAEYPPVNNISQEPLLTMQQQGRQQAIGHVQPKVISDVVSK